MPRRARTLWAGMATSKYADQPSDFVHCVPSAAFLAASRRVSTFFENESTAGDGTVLRVHSAAKTSQAEKKKQRKRQNVESIFFIIMRLGNRLSREDN